MIGPYALNNYYEIITTHKFSQIKNGTRDPSIVSRCKVRGFSNSTLFPVPAFCANPAMSRDANTVVACPTNPRETLRAGSPAYQIQKF